MRIYREMSSGRYEVFVEIPSKANKDFDGLYTCWICVFSVDIKIEDAGRVRLHISNTVYRRCTCPEILTRAF